MTKKMIELQHDVCDYTCMWRGIEDLYQTKTNEKVPGWLFFTLSGIGEFTYLRMNKADLKRMVTWGDGRPKKIYQKVNDIIGFDFKHMEGTKFDHMLKIAKAQIDIGKPVVLGPLDMYYLPYYPKMYQNMHIPNHYVMMVGYDEEQQCAFILDCGAEKVEKLPYSELEKSLAMDCPGIGKKNGLCFIDFKEDIPALFDIIRDAFTRKCTRVLQSKVCFTGIRGMRLLAGEIDNWREEFNDRDYDRIIRSFVEFTGCVPTLPERLYGQPQDSIVHNANRQNYSELLLNLTERYHVPEWKEAGELFAESGRIIQDITDRMVEYLLGNAKEVGKVADKILKIAEIEELANQKILGGIK